MTAKSTDLSRFAVLDSWDAASVGKAVLALIADCEKLGWYAVNWSFHPPGWYGTQDPMRQRGEVVVFCDPQGAHE